MRVSDSFILVDNARWFAIGAHGNQKRKYTNLPYYTHLESVVNILSKYYMDLTAYTCGWLHDVVEDTTFSVLDIQQLFGVEIAHHVNDLTEPSVPGKNRAWRKAAYNEQLANSCALVQTVKYADLLDNTESINKYDIDFAKIYLKEIRVLLPLIQKGDPTLYRLVCEQVKL